MIWYPKNLKYVDFSNELIRARVYKKKFRTQEIQYTRTIFLFGLIFFNFLTFLIFILARRWKYRKGTPKESPKQQNCKCCWLGWIEPVQNLLNIRDNLFKLRPMVKDGIVECIVLLYIFYCRERNLYSYDAILFKLSTVVGSVNWVCGV